MKYLPMLFLLPLAQSAIAQEVILSADKEWIMVLSDTEAGSLKSKNRTKDFFHAESAVKPTEDCSAGRKADAYDKEPYYSSSGHGIVWACSNSGKITLSVNKSTDAVFEK